MFYFLVILFPKDNDVKEKVLYVNCVFFKCSHCSICFFEVLRSFNSRSGNLGTTDFTYSTRSIDGRMLRTPKALKSALKQYLPYSGPRF